MPNPDENGLNQPAPRLAYWDRSQYPLQGVFFLLPLILLYELGTIYFATDHARGVTHYIYARSLLRDLFELLGATGYYLPGLVVITVLMSSHLLRHDPWRLEPRLWGVMWLESCLLAAPLFVFGLLLFSQPIRQMALAATDSPAATGWQAQLVFSIGAGIYEELLFRLIAIAVFHTLLVNLLALPKPVGAAGAIGLSALAFALYHFSDQNPFTLPKGLFYAGAGVYLAVIYVCRGFGIVAGTHAIYDVMVVALQLRQSQ